MFASPLISELLPDDVRHDFEALHDDESRHHLEALGYSISEIARFRADLDEYEMADPEGMAHLRKDLYWGFPLPGSEESPDEEEAEMLAQLCALDGELILDQLPEGEWPVLLRRMIAFRLDKLGLISADDPCPPAAVLRPVLERVRRALAGSSILQVANLCGDMNALCKALMASNRGLLYLHFDGKEAYRSRLKNQAGKDFLTSLQASLAAEVWEEFDREVVENHGRKAREEDLYAYLDTQQTAFGNVLQSRVLQLKLWMQGFCETAPDGPWSADSQDALLDFLRLIREEEGDFKEERNRAILQLGKNDWVVNLVRLQELCGEINGEESEPRAFGSGSLIDSLREWYDSPSEDKDSSGEAMDLQATIRARLQELAHDVPSSQKRKSPPTVGRQGIYRIFQWIHRKASSFKAALQTFLNRVKGGSRGLLTLLRQGFYRLARTLDFLVRKPEITSRRGSARVSSSFTPGFDMLHTCKGEVDPELLALHLRRLESLSDRLTDSAKALGNLLQWGLDAAKGPVGWVQIGVRVVGMFQNPVNTSALKENAAA